MARVPANQFTQLMEAITASQRHMDAKFTEFQVEIWQGQEDAAKALKRAKYKKPYTYPKKGNEEQAVINSEVDEAIPKAEEQLAEIAPPTLPALQKARDSHKNG